MHKKPRRRRVTTRQVHYLKAVLECGSGWLRRGRQWQVPNWDMPRLPTLTLHQAVLLSGADVKAHRRRAILAI
jgi:hypothetical protein